MRQFRELSDETKRKISTSMVNRPKSDQHKQNISKSMKEYWQTIPNKPQTDAENKSTNTNSNAKKKNV